MHAFPPFNQVKDCKYGKVLFNTRDIYVGKSFELYGEFSDAEVELFQQMIKPDDVVVDIGANIGAHTLYFARAVGPRGAVLAFEPQRIVYQTLCANMALNSVTNAYCFHAAVGQTPGQILVPPLDYNREGNYGGLGLGEFQQGEQVQVLPIDGLGLGRCKLLKVDVEGMEREVLMGCALTIQRLSPILYVENDRDDKSADLIRYIDSIGYKMFWHRPPLYNPNNFFKNPQNVFGNVVSLNMLCVPKSATTNLTGFPPVEVPA